MRLREVQGADVTTADLDVLTSDTVHLLADGRVDRIFGPPGTGKTTRLARDVAETARIRGGDTLLLASFTTTAAHALRASSWDAAKGNPAARVPDDRIGTLHSFGYRMLGRPEVALDPKVVADWNQHAPHEWRLTPDSRRAQVDVAIETGMMTGDADVDSARSGDELLAAMDMRRATLTPTTEWPPELVAFAQRWSDWKTDSGVADFGDMIQEALRAALDGEPAPGRPKVVIADEAQDLTPAETALVLAWGRQAETLVIAGDDDQAINEWRGGSAAPILRIGLDAAGESRTDLDLRDTVLDYSWRVPSTVHAVAVDWISRIEGERYDKEYRPRDGVAGSIDCSGLSIVDPRLVDSIMRDIERGETVMVIAPCGYMLQALTGNLRRLGVPFGNVYRPAEAKWNPLRPAPRGVSTAEKLYRYLVVDERLLGDDSRLWTGDDVRAWTSLVGSRAAQFVRNAKEMIERMGSGPVPFEDIAALFKTEEAQEAATGPDIDWLLSCALKASADALAYPAAVTRSFGPRALVTRPPLTIGTIHSVKGGEADHVYIDPTLSSAGARQWHERGSRRDQITRLMYVALTRAKKRVTVLHPTSHGAVPRGMLVPQEMRVAHG